MDQYFFEMTALGWTYHSRLRSSDAGQRQPRLDRCFIGLFGGLVVRLDTLAAVRLFLAFYWSNAGTVNFEQPSFCLHQHILAMMGLMPPDTFVRHTSWWI